MNIGTNIIDALRRRGTNTQKSALARMDEQLKGKTLLERRRQLVDGPFGKVEGFIATIEPVPERLERLDAEAINLIRENATLAPAMLRAFSGTEVEQFGLAELDKAFELWITAEDKRGYSEEAVVEILGAAFGEYCLTNLDMQWAKLIDEIGAALVVEGRMVEIRAFPYDCIRKRIANREYGFFEGIFTLTQNMAKEGRPRTVEPGQLD